MDKAAKEKQRQRRPKDQDAVQVYYYACIDFGDALEDGVGAAEFGKFAPEAGRFVMGRHDQLRAELARLEGALGVSPGPPKTRKPRKHWTDDTTDPRVARVLESVAEDRRRAEAKRRRDPHEVKTYLDELRAFRAAVVEVAGLVGAGGLSPDLTGELSSLVEGWHYGLRTRLDQLDRVFRGDQDKPPVW